MSSDEQGMLLWKSEDKKQNVKVNSFCTLLKFRPYHYLGFIRRTDPLEKSGPRTQKEKDAVHTKSVGSACGAGH